MHAHMAHTHTHTLSSKVEGGREGGKYEGGRQGREEGEAGGGRKGRGGMTVIHTLI